ncbi:hypothetical protein BH11MYX1_BH11MYX1_56440 [soil metagenome]
MGVTLLDSSTMTRFVLLVAMLSACSKKGSDQGLAPAQDWGAANQAGAGPGPQQPQPGAPAAGMAMPSAADLPPMAGMGNAPATGDIPDVVDENGNNPHAGLKRNAQAGAAAGVDPSKMGALAPDPNRKIDPTHRITGVIAIHPKAADRAKAGGAIFVTVKKADASGNPTGTPLAVDKLVWSGQPLPFELTEGQAMIAGTELSGDVVVMARYDQDGDAMTKQPGDIIGSLRVKVPADKANIFLDDILP